MDTTALSFSLLAATIGVAVIHTLLGPDHYLPFIMLSRARRWSLARTLTVTLVCGIGHVASSVVLGGIGVAAGVAIGHLELVEGTRGDLAAWALVAFGLAYMVWGIRTALRHRRGLEPHEHHGHVHLHAHGAHHHHHDHEEVGRATTFWALFIVFVLGPCEPLIPLFMVPASRGAWHVAAAVAVVFGIVTVGAMLVVVGLGWAGLAQLRLGVLERWTHALAGGTLAAAGFAVIFLGL